MKTQARFLAPLALFAILASSALAQESKPAEKPKDEPNAVTPATIEKLIYVRLTTTKGDIIIELNNEKAPISTANFLSYVDSGFYGGTVFHRVMADFMIQGGGFTKDGRQKATSAPIQNEWKNGLKNVKGTLAMARRGDGRPNEETVNSGTSQFFINVKDNPGLDQKQADGGAYAVFGKVVGGMDVVEAIRTQKVVPDQRGEMSKPVEPVEVTAAARLTKDEASKYAPAAAPAPEEKKEEKPADKKEDKPGK